MPKTSGSVINDSIKEITDKKPDYYNLDVRSKSDLKNFFDNNKVDGIIHFAAFKAVGESMEKPLDYYENNPSNSYCNFVITPKVEKFEKVFSEKLKK